MCLKSNRTDVTNNWIQFQITWFCLQRNPPWDWCIFLFFSATLFCTAGRILLGFLSALSSCLSWWPPHLWNRSLWCDPLELCGWKVSIRKDQGNRKVVPVRWCSSWPGTASCSAHPVPLLFKHAQNFGDNLLNTVLFHIQPTYDYLNSQPTIATHHLSYLLDIDLTPVCWRPPAPRVIFQLFITLNFFCHSRICTHNMLSISIQFAETFQVFVTKFFSTGPKNFRFIYFSVLIKRCK